MASLEELKASKEARIRARQEKKETLEREALELEEKLCSDGKEAGVDFVVVTTAIGNFVVNKPEFVVAKRLIDKGERTTEDVVSFVLPCVSFPDRTSLTPVFQEHGGIAWRLLDVALAMFAADDAAYAGK